jgi:hypothetical protein
MGICRGLATPQAGRNEGSKGRESPSPNPRAATEPFDVEVAAKDIILADVTLNSDRELSKEVQLTLAKWVRT